MAETMQTLEAEYCPPLDPGVVIAISSDYDLSNEADLRKARADLDQLKEAAALEEQTGFDPSGTGSLDDTGDFERHHSSETDNEKSTSHETDQTSISNELSSLDLSVTPPETSAADAARAEAFAADMQKLDEDTKIQLLSDVFGDGVNAYTIKHTLRKCDGKWDAAFEQLLNIVYLQDEEGSDGSVKANAKGIDAFFDENANRQSRNRKAKARNQRRKNQQRSRSNSFSPERPASSGGVSNKWKTAAEDIDFIATRTGLTRAAISSVYNSNGASVPQTIVALLKESMKDGKTTSIDNTTLTNNVRELGLDFPNITSDYLTAIIRMTHPSTTAAHELAKALTAKPKATEVGGIRVIPQYKPPEGLTDEAGWTTASKRKGKSSRSTSPDTTPPASPYIGAVGSSHGNPDFLRNRAFEQASAAHRKAKSDRLMGGAAGYYAQVGRGFAAQALSMNATRMDQLVASNSSTGKLDLHGVDVLNAKRIACERVETWWEGLGENRVNGRLGATDRAAGFRIVVGRGRHSAGGKGLLGPAVSKALREDGWGVEAAEGELIVRGPAKR